MLTYGQIFAICVVMPFEITVGGGVQPRLAQVGQNSILFKPGPQHGKIVDLFKFADVKPATAFSHTRALQVVDDLAFARAGRSAAECQRCFC
jgi:hypothetical protein